jgi:hypothetical protein
MTAPASPKVEQACSKWMTRNSPTVGLIFPDAALRHFLEHGTKRLRTRTRLRRVPNRSPFTLHSVVPENGFCRRRHGSHAGV